MNVFAHNLKKARTSRGLSLKNLSALSGVSVSMLSAIEQNEKVPSLITARQISSALSLSISDLADDRQHPKATIVLGNERKTLYEPTTGVEGQLLSPGFPTSKLDFISGKIPPKSKTGTMAAHSHGSEEYILLTQGKMAVVLNDIDSYILDANDSIHFEADVPHEFVNLGNSECHYLLVRNHRVEK